MESESATQIYSNDVHFNNNQPFKLKYDLSIDVGNKSTLIHCAYFFLAKYNCILCNICCHAFCHLHKYTAIYISCTNLSGKQKTIIVKVNKVVDG